MRTTINNEKSIDWAGAGLFSGGALAILAALYFGLPFAWDVYVNNAWPFYTSLPGNLWSFFVDSVAAAVEKESLLMVPVYIALYAGLAVFAAMLALLSLVLLFGATAFGVVLVGGFAVMLLKVSLTPQAAPTGPSPVYMPGSYADRIADAKAVLGIPSYRDVSKNDIWVAYKAVTAGRRGDWSAFKNARDVLLAHIESVAEDARQAAEDKVFEEYYSFNNFEESAPDEYIDPEIQAAADTLGVAPDANKDVVQQAWRKLAKQYHPDRHPEGPARERATELMSAANTARDVLMQAL